MTRVVPLLILAAGAAGAHVMSMSSGDLVIDGAHARYELRMPLYEIAHVANPDRVLLDHVIFTGAHLTRKECHTDQARDTFLCVAEYDFPAAPDGVEVECTLPSVTVANHVHLLRAELGGKRDEAVFDRSFTRATLRFRPPSMMEIAITQSGAGFVRALGGAVQILFLAALVLAARSRRELGALFAMFLAGQIASALLAPRSGWTPPARFVEAAAALTIAYLAVEILALPKAGARWLIAGVLGAFHGLYFHLFLQNTGYHAALVLGGAALAEALVASVIYVVFARVLRVAQPLRPVASCASALLIFGLVWFFVRLQG